MDKAWMPGSGQGGERIRWDSDQQKSDGGGSVRVHAVPFEPRVPFGWISAVERVCSQARALALSNFGNISSSPTCIVCKS